MRLLRLSMFGADKGNRTLATRLGRPATHLVRTCENWWDRNESNVRPVGFQATSCLVRHGRNRTTQSWTPGLQPSGNPSPHKSRRFVWLVILGSNQATAD